MGRGRPRKYLTWNELKNAARILNLDVEAGGALHKIKCPIHGRKNLTYRLIEGSERVRVTCQTCGWTTDYIGKAWHH